MSHQRVARRARSILLCAGTPNGSAQSSLSSLAERIHLAAWCETGRTDSQSTTAPEDAERQIREPAFSSSLRPQRTRQAPRSCG